MQQEDAKRLIKETFDDAFDADRFRYFAKNLLNDLDESKAFRPYHGNYIRDAFRDSIRQYQRIGQYIDPEGHALDVLAIELKRESSLERARTMQRNFVAWYLNHRDQKDAALVAYYTPGAEDWRFSFVQMNYATEQGDGGKIKVKKELTPARRYSFLVGKNEPNHTAQQLLFPILLDDRRNPTLREIEDAYSIEKVTKEFFLKYKELFLLLNEALDKIVNRDSKIKQEFESKQIDVINFAKKLLGQIVFLYFLQKKGWLGVGKDGQGDFKAWGSGPKNFLQKLFRREIVPYHNFFNDILEPLFYEALATERENDYYSRFNCKIPFLNGGLFEPTGGYDWQQTDILIDDTIFKQVFQTFDLFNFTVREDEPLEKEVAVDPEMLGKVFENLLEIKDRKSKGAYYTPREIVHYMCRESLINYLAREHAPLRKDIEFFIRMGEQAIEHDRRIETEGRETSDYKYEMRESIRQNAGEIDAALADIKICDPAIGSGAFPVGMMQEIVKARLVLNTYLGDGGNRTSYNFKRHAIHENLYGVDIDPGAVDIAKLRLWLSLVVDEEDYYSIKPLPNLDYKIVCGDSLLGYPYKPQGLEKIEKLKDVFFEETVPNRKRKLKEDIDEAIHSLFKNTERNLGYPVSFDFHINFSEVFHNGGGGFDVVIANPPYVRQEQIKEYKPLFKNTYKCYSGVADIYVYFYECGFNLLAKNGVQTFITSNKYMRARYGEKLRQFLSNSAIIKQLIDFGDAPVFEATSYPSIILLQKGKSNANQVKALNWQRETPVEEFERVVHTGSFLIAQRELTDNGWLIESPAVLRLLEKLRKAGQPLGEYVKGRFYYGIKTGLNEAFVVDSATRDRLIAEHPSSAEVLKPFLRGRDVKRWRVEPKDLWLIFTRRGIDIKKYPAIYEHLSKFMERLTPGIPGGRKPGSYKWYEIQDNIAYWQEFEQPKIVYPDIATQCQFTLELDNRYPDCTIFLIPQGSTKILGLLNSQLTEFFFSQISPRIRANYMRFKSIYVSQIPIATGPEDVEIEELVAQILMVKHEDPFADVTAFERKIDQLVYRLYGLTDEEIRIVEEAE